MAIQTVMSALCLCSFGAAPAPLMVSSQANVMACTQLVGTIMDTTLPSFGMCSNPANPAVAAATAAKLGVFTPAPCVPAIAGPWMLGNSTVLIGGKPALDNTGKLSCAYPGGIIQVTMPIAQTVDIP